MAKNHIYNSSLFGSITEFDFFAKCSCIMSCLSIFYEWSTPTVELPAMVVVALVKDLCNLFIHAHLYHHGPQPKDSIKHASEEANFDCGLKR